jgi:hypothetical protein
MIDFTRAFDSAWERMHVILFRPFDFGKWFVIGFSAFLAGFLQGGNGFSYRFNYNINSDWNQNQNVELQKIHDSIMEAFRHWQTGAYVLIILAAIVLGFALGVLFLWLGARGQFLFLDNIVRNRGAIAWPWSHYSRQGNSLFFFHLAVMLISFAIFLPILIVAVVMAIPLFQQDRWPAGWETVGFIALGLVYFALALVFSFFLFVYREFGVPLMFRNGLMARDAFMKSMRLIMAYPGSIILFVLLRIAIFIGVTILSVIICCVTCCIGMLPYIGTVILLPVLIYVKCFTLDCLAQFGPEYDIWTVDVPPSGSVGIPTFNPQRPPG